MGTSKVNISTPDGTKISIESGTKTKAKPKSKVKQAKPKQQVEDLQRQISKAQTSPLPEFSYVPDLNANGFDLSTLKKKPDELGNKEFFESFTKQELELVSRSISTLLQHHKVDTEDQDNLGFTIALEKLRDSLNIAKDLKISEKLEDKLGSLYINDYAQRFYEKDFLDVLTANSTNPFEKNIKTASQNLLAYLKKVANYEEIDPKDAPF